jgi:hypothetical protein
MLWLGKIKSNDNYSINFYQVFIENNLVYIDNDSNAIYSFDSTNSTDSNKLTRLNFNLENCYLDNIICEIKMIDHIISYDILSTSPNENNVFISKFTFIKPEENNFGLPIFSYSYKLTSTKRLPNLIESEYNYMSILNFQIYKLDKENQVQFIIETNPKTNEVRKYFLVTNLDLIKPFVM